MAMPTFETLDPKTTTEWSVEFKNYKGDKAEISGIVSQLSIYESIYNNCMFGNIKIQDGTGFVEANGIVGSGEEEVHFTLETPNTGMKKTANLEKEFKIKFDPDQIVEIKNVGELIKSIEKKIKP